MNHFTKNLFIISKHILKQIIFLIIKSFFLVYFFVANEITKKIIKAISFEYIGLEELQPSVLQQ